MKNFVLSDSTRRDLAEVWTYMSRDSLEYADMVIESLLEQFGMSAADCYFRRERDEFGAGIGTTVEGEFVTFDRLVGEDVQVIRVAPGKRYLRELLTD